MDIQENDDEAVIADLKSKLERAESKIEQYQLEMRALRASQAQYDDQLKTLDAKIGRAKEALIPFTKKTRQWENQWPHLDVRCIGLITWRDIKNAAEAGGTL